MVSRSRPPRAGRPGRILQWFILHSDIHARKRAEALLAGEKQLLELVATGSPVRIVLEALCRLVEQTEAGCFCSVVVFDPAVSRIDYVVAPSLPTSYNEALAGRATDREGGRWSAPILSQAGEVLGTFALYRPEAGKPTSERQELIDRFTHVGEHCHRTSAERGGVEAERVVSRGSATSQPDR